MPVTNAVADTALRFSFAEMEREIVNMSKMASAFFDNDLAIADTVIAPWLRQLRNFAATATHDSEISWGIPRNRPIRTKLSPGKYEPDSNGEHTVYATVSAIWQIAIPSAEGPAKKKSVAHQHFMLKGNASTVVTVFDHCGGNQPRELARWRFEVGTSDSPGCHFHVQVLGDKDDLMFPHTMSIPRLPGLLFTPMDALEFVLAELFQDEWKQHVSKGNDQIKGWSSCQRTRIVNLLRWQQEKIAGYTGSPWTSFKAEKPFANLMLAEATR